MSRTIFPNFVAFHRKPFRIISSSMCTKCGVTATKVLACVYLIYVLLTNLFGFAAILAVCYGFYGLIRKRVLRLREANFVIALILFIKIIWPVVITYIFTLVTLFDFEELENMEPETIEALASVLGFAMRWMKRIFKLFNIELDGQDLNSAWWAWFWLVVIAWVQFLVIYALPGWLGMTAIESVASHYFKTNALAMESDLDRRDYYLVAPGERSEVTRLHPVDLDGSIVHQLIHENKMKAKLTIVPDDENISPFYSILRPEDPSTSEPSTTTTTGVYTPYHSDHSDGSSGPIKSFFSKPDAQEEPTMVAPVTNTQIKRGISKTVGHIGSTQELL